ncbi:MAG: ribose 5-phosphate isomerase B [Bacillus thermozeamaize]|uniref:Ribose 5-phosphate isomerase B n=1 Tax=Bacillus thermozeamaize TaxID=230954 RepID=A0A1Y3PCM4_9BACI|nr:MAG: ribose 5-phosphate isomerase B [Bacillus thermozeamaize]
MRVALAADHGGFRLKEEIKKELEEMGVIYEDFGTHSPDSVDYPDFAIPVAKKVAAGEFDRGILICGTGIGMTIAANKVRGIRCALVHDAFSARATREHNDSNLLAMGERVIGPGLAREIVRIWLTTPFAGGRHQRRIEKIRELEAQEHPEPDHLPSCCDGAGK